MKTFTIFAGLAAFASLATAVPVRNTDTRSTTTKVYTVTVVEHVSKTSTVWVDPTPTAEPTRKPVVNDISEDDDKKDKEDKEEKTTSSSTSTTTPTATPTPTPTPTLKPVVVAEKKEEVVEEKKDEPAPTTGGGAMKYSGIASYYTELTEGNYGSCGNEPTFDKTLKAVALPKSMMDAALASSGKTSTNDNPLCNKIIKACNKAGKCVNLPVYDTCPGCKSTYGIDLTEAAFEYLGPADGLMDVTWDFV